ncbi:MAG: M4 family metallopeptidase [Flammeovirgaceae bacterium]
MRFTRTLILLIIFTGIIGQNSFAQETIKNGKRKKEKQHIAPSFPYESIDHRQHEQKQRQQQRFTPLAKPNRAIKGKQLDHQLLAVKRSESGLPIFIQGQLNATTQRLNQIEQVYATLDELSSLLRVSNPQEEFTIKSVETDALGQTHTRLSQYYQGVRVYGSELILHQSTANYRITGRHFASPEKLTTTPTLALDWAKSISKDHLTTTKNRSWKSPHAQAVSHLHFQHFQHELVVYHLPNQTEKDFLVWHLTVRPNLIERWEYFVDAHNGEILHHYNHTCSIDGPRTAQATDLNGVTQTINTYEIGSEFHLFDGSRSMFNNSINDPEGAIITLDFQNTNLNDPQYAEITSNTNAWNDRAAVSAHVNAGEAYAYFKEVHGRNSINGQGGNIISFINVADDDGSGLDNAFWNGQYIFYGNGDFAFDPLAGALDVAGHEMSHGVIQNTANLEYMGESGAINESMADIFGAMMDREDWQIGEDVTRINYISTGALRDMQDPHNGGSSLNDPGYQPKHMDEKYNGSENNGGVHINSGIVNHAFYQIATSIGRSKAEQIYYRALSTYLTASSQFIDLRIAVIQSATDLHGSNSTEVQAIKAGFDAVGITDGEPTDPFNDVDPATGNQFILSYDVSPSISGTLYLSSTSGTNFVEINDTELNRKPSVTRDGQFAYYISTDKKMRRVNLEGVPNESIIQGEPIWDNVAVSPDGRKLAAISIDIDTTVWVYSFDLERWAAFKLYNPTFSQGVSTGEVLYADAIEWDVTSEYVMYDAFNKLTSFSGEALDYWDIGIMRVWDETNSNFGDGLITKLFAGLPENVSVGNATFAKNSPYIVAFDFIDHSGASSALILMTANLETGDVEEVFTNQILSYPNYATNDDKLIFDALNSANDEVVAEIPLHADKLSPSGNATVLIADAKWGIWFAQDGNGIVSALEEEFPAFAQALNLYPNPAMGSEIMLDLDLTIKSPIEVKIYDAMGKSIKALTYQPASGHQTQISVPIEDLQPNTYFIKIQADRQLAARKFVKL